MQTGIELIAKERQEQIDKHGYTPEKDKHYTKKELIHVATAILNKEPSFWPHSWSIEKYNKICSKPKKERLAIAGALIAAEIDRVLLEENM